MFPRWELSTHEPAGGTPRPWDRETPLAAVDHRCEPKPAHRPAVGACEEVARSLHRRAMPSPLGPPWLALPCPAARERDSARFKMLQDVERDRRSGALRDTGTKGHT